MRELCQSEAGKEGSGLGNVVAERLVALALWIVFEVVGKPMAVLGEEFIKVEIPKLDGLVIAARGEGLAVRTETHVPDSKR